MRFTLIATPLLLAAASNGIPAFDPYNPLGLIHVTWKHLAPGLGGENNWILKCGDVQYAMCVRNCKDQDLNCRSACLKARSDFDFELIERFEPIGKFDAAVKCGNAVETILVIRNLGWTILY